MTMQLERPLETNVRHFRLSLDQYEEMVRQGIIGENDRVELIDGELIEMTPTGSRHAAVVKRLNRTLGRLLGDDALVGVQDPIRLPDFSAPEPDVTVLVPRNDAYASAHPAPADILLVVEVADTSLEYDRRVKGALYAVCGIREYWLVNLNLDQLEVHRIPVNGRYESRGTFHHGDTIAPEAFPDALVAVDDLLGPPERATPPA